VIPNLEGGRIDEPRSQPDQARPNGRQPRLGESTFRMIRSADCIADAVNNSVRGELLDSINSPVFQVTRNKDSGHDPNHPFAALVHNRIVHLSRCLRHGSGSMLPIEKLSKTVEWVPPQCAPKTVQFLARTTSHDAIFPKVQPNIPVFRRNGSRCWSRPKRIGSVYWRV
jgi:hypothetical protein